MIKQPDDIVLGLPNCGVVAVAAALNLSYAEVEAYFRKGRANQWKGRSSWSTVAKAVEHFNFKFEAMIGGGSLAKWVDFETQKNATYIVATRTHFVAVKNNIVVDQQEAKHASEHRSKRKIVKCGIKIFPKKKKGRSNERLQ